VIKEISIRAQPEAVFAYFTEVDKLLLWLGVEARLEPKIGGVFHVTIKDERKIIGEYLEIQPYSKVLFSWGWEGREDVPPGSSKVEVLLQPVPEGTLVWLRHYDLPENALPLHAKSWEYNLPRLKHQLENLSNISSFA
jgi:uncharacterized protein YndB with AHSA1/START domain